MLTDEELLARTATGDDDAFAAFYRRHFDPVVAYLRKRLPAPEHAFDLAAETFAVIALRPADFRGDGAATAWLYGIARNLLRESLRRGRIEAGARTVRRNRTGHGGGRRHWRSWRRSCLGPPRSRQPAGSGSATRTRTTRGARTRKFSPVFGPVRPRRLGCE